MTNIEHLVNEVKSEFKSASKYQITAQFYPYKNISHTIRKKNEVIFIRLSDKLINANDDILKAIMIILVNKLFKVKTPYYIKKNYRQYINKHVIPHLPDLKRQISSRYNAAGRYFNLDTIFEKVNEDYFSSSLEKPALGWSLNKSVRRLGFYDHERNLLVISKLFDHGRVPLYVLEYIMYHEMLHILHPVEKVNGRRIVHSRQFKRQEILFKEYTLAIRWINKKLWRLKISF